MTTQLTLVRLNLDCLREILKHCDLLTLSYLADVCKLLRDIIRTEFFPKHTAYECIFVDRDDYLSIQKKKMKNIGNYLRKLKIHIRCDLATCDYIPFFKRIESCIGTNIRELTFVSPVLPKNLVEMFRIIFARLESLTMVVLTFDDEYEIDEIDYRSLCPNLLHLHLQGDCAFTPNSQQWRQLESLSIGDNDFVSNETMRTFFMNNRRLKRLKTCTFNADLLIEDVVKFLPNLEQWTIFQNNSNLDRNNAALLGNLQQLYDLKILRIYGEELNGIVSGLGKCLQLKYLTIQANHEGDEEVLTQLNQHDILTVVAELTQLETFTISCCKFSEAFLSDFVKFAAIGLKELHLHNCRMQPNDAMIANISRQISLRHKEKDSINRMPPLKICFGQRHIVESLNPDGQCLVQVISCKLIDEDQHMFDI